MGGAERGEGKRRLGGRGAGGKAWRHASILVLRILAKNARESKSYIFSLAIGWEKRYKEVIKGHEMSEQPTSAPSAAPREPALIQPLLGRADHRLDPKRRFTIPTDWYERMGRPPQVYVMPSLSHLSGPARCLDVFCPAEFDRRMEAFRHAALSDAAKAAFTSRIGELISCLSVDTMNRIRVKDSLLAFAGLESDVVLIGAGYHIEVWSPANRPKLDGAEADVLASLVADAQNLGF